MVRLARPVRARPILALLAITLCGCGTIRAGYMVRDAFRPAAELAAEVDESRMVVRTLGQDVPVRIYRPTGATGAKPAVVLVHGAVAEGAEDPRLIALARAMAIRGGTIATPDLPSLRAFRLDPDDPTRVAAVARVLSGREDLVKGGRVAFVGISVGGSYGLLAALDPRLEGRVSTVLTFGAYADLGDLVSRWMTDPLADAPDLFDPRTWGRRLVLRGNLNALVPADERSAVAGVLDELLAGQHDVAAPPGLTPRAGLVVAVAISEDPIDPKVVAEILAPLEDEIRSLSPVHRPRAPTIPVHLLHGETDPIVPVGDLVVLEAFLSSHGGRVTSHRTDLFTHVGQTGDATPSLVEAWPLLSFLADAMADAGF